MTEKQILIKQLADDYRYAPDEFDLISEHDLHNFRRFVNYQYSILTKAHILYFDFVDYEPYGTNPSVHEIRKDFLKGIIKIHTTGNDSKVWGKFYNLQFRAIHDYIHCRYSLDFTHDNEMEVFQRQIEFSNWQLPFDVNFDLYTKVLRSEIVYQSSYKEVFGEFHIDQKIILKNL